MLENTVLDWSFAQAVAWICTRDMDLVRDIANPYSPDTLQAQILKFTFARSIAETEVEDRQRGKYAASNEAVLGLEEGILTGRIFTWARDVGTGARSLIPPRERIDLQFAIWPDDPIRPYGFCLKSTKTCRWVEPRHRS